MTAKFRVDMKLSLAPLLRMLPFPSRYSCCEDKVLPFLTVHITGCLIPRLPEVLAEIPAQWGALLAKPWVWHLHRSACIKAPWCGEQEGVLRQQRGACGTVMEGKEKSVSPFLSSPGNWFTQHYNNKHWQAAQHHCTLVVSELWG